MACRVASGVVHLGGSVDLHCGSLDCGGYDLWSALEWHTRQPMPHLGGSTPSSRKALVHESVRCGNLWWFATIRKHLHRGLLFVHIVLALQVLLRLRLLVDDLRHPADRHVVRHDRRRVLFAQHRGLSMAMDGILFGCWHCCLRVHLLDLLLLYADANERLLAD
jgi:hypothetical protein